MLDLLQIEVSTLIIFVELIESCLLEVRRVQIE